MSSCIVQCFNILVQFLAPRSNTRKYPPPSGNQNSSSSWEGKTRPATVRPIMRNFVNKPLRLNQNNYCNSTVVRDRWQIAAAHSFTWYIWVLVATIWVLCNTRFDSNKSDLCRLLCMSVFRKWSSATMCFLALPRMSNRWLLFRLRYKLDLLSVSPSLRREQGEQSQRLQ